MSAGALAGRDVLVAGATGGVGSGTARLLARQGAHVWLAARDRARVQALADEIRAEGCAADGHAVDATDAEQVDAWVADVVRRAGAVHGAFTAVGQTPAALGYPARSDTLPAEVFERPLRLVVTSTFLVARSAARAMAPGAGGSVVTLSATLSGGAFAHMAALTAACGAVEAMTYALSGEYLPRGVRVNCVRGDAMPETTTIQETGAAMAALADVAGPGDPPAGQGVPVTVAQTAATVAFLLSDAASGTSGQVLTVSGSPLAGA